MAHERSQLFLKLNKQFPEPFFSLSLYNRHKKGSKLIVFSLFPSIVSLTSNWANFGNRAILKTNISLPVYNACVFSAFYLGVAQKWLHKNTRDRVFQIFLYFTLFVIFFSLFPPFAAVIFISPSLVKFFLCGIFFLL